MEIISRVADPVEHFADAARRFCAWAEGEPASAETEVKAALRFLADLTAAIMATANAGCGEDVEEESVPDAEWHNIYKRFGSLPFNYYSTFFRPALLHDEKPVIGDLADDLADTYRDIKAGLYLYDRGHKTEAVWSWRSSFQAHWGRHAASALYALQAWRSDNGLQI